MLKPPSPSWPWPRPRQNNSAPTTTIATLTASNPSQTRIVTSGLRGPDGAYGRVMRPVSPGSVQHGARRAFGAARRLPLSFYHNRSERPAIINREGPRPPPRVAAPPHLALDGAP